MGNRDKILKMLSKTLSHFTNLGSQSRRSLAMKSMMTTTQSRQFGALGDELNTELFEHKFTNDMEFRSSFDKIKCFRVMDEEGNIINPGYDTTIPDETLVKMYDTMVTMNETDTVYNAA